jgi:hypothetical protein
MRQAGLLLMIVAFVIASPVLIPIALILHARDQRRMQTAAATASCEHCGATLGTESLRRADAAWATHVSALQQARPTIRFRLVRRLWATCATCDAEYDFDATLRTFRRLPVETTHRR